MEIVEIQYGFYEGIMDTHGAAKINIDGEHWKLVSESAGRAIEAFANRCGFIVRTEQTDELLGTIRDIR